MKLVKIILDKDRYDLLADSDALPNHKLLEIFDKDDFFANDETHKKLQTSSIKAYKSLKEYEFKMRNKQFNNPQNEA